MLAPGNRRTMRNDRIERKKCSKEDADDRRIHHEYGNRNYRRQEKWQEVIRRILDEIGNTCDPAIQFIREVSYLDIVKICYVERQNMAIKLGGKKRLESDGQKVADPHAISRDHRSYHIRCKQNSQRPKHR